MSTDFVVFCIADVSTAPVALARRTTTGAFYSHIPVPIPSQLVIFAEGQWEAETGDLDVTLSYKDDQIHLGYVTRSNRCICWKRDSTKDLPTSMISDSEEGVAKLLVERSEGPPVLQSMVDDLKVLEETQNTPDRHQKKKRRSSLNKEEKNSGPLIKKQKLQGEKPGTRQRTPKTEKEPKVGKNEKEKKRTPQIKKVSKNGSEIAVTEQNGMGNKSVDDKTVTSSEAHPSAKTNSSKKKGEYVSNIGKKKLEENSLSDSNPDSLPEITNGRDSQLSDKKLKASVVDTPTSTKAKGKGKQTRKSLDSNPSTPVEASGKKRGRKKVKAGEEKLDGTKTDTLKCENTAESIVADLHCTGKSIQVDVGLVVEPEQIGEEKDCGSTKTSDKMDISGKKMAMCKDLTSRAYDRPSKRWGHSLCFVNKNMLVLIGGQGEKQQLNKDSVWALDAETRRWRSLSTQSEGQKPEYRMGHTASYDPMVRCIYVFGGSKNTRWFHDVHILDTDEWKWQLVKVSGKAPTRAYHSATLYRHELWIFGGVYPRPDPQPDGCSNDIHIFSPVMESWYNPIVKGVKPIPRSGHSATLLGDQLVVFGGWDAPISYQDLHVLDMSIVEWTQPEIIGSPPSPRSWHASCALSNNRVLIHGGYNGDIALNDTFIFNLTTVNWSKIEVDSSPEARVGHKALCVPYRYDNEEEDEVIIFGGGDNDGAYFEDLLGIYIPFNVESS